MFGETPYLNGYECKLVRCDSYSISWIEVILVLIHDDVVFLGQQTKWICTLTNRACELSNNQYILSFAVSPTGSD